MNATIKDICRATGFSTATVSRVLNNSPLVTDTTKEKVQAALDKLNYRPHHAARALKLNRTGMVGVVFPELDNGFFTEVLRGVDEMASEFQIHLLTAFTHGAQDEEELITRMVREHLADALILMHLTLKEDFLRQLIRWNLPIVLIDRPLKDNALVSVGIDNRHGMEEMTRHLLDQGHRRIVFVSGPSGTYDAEERLSVYRKTMKAAGVPVPASSIWQGQFTEESGAYLMKQFLTSGAPLPDAIFAANDAMAIGIHAVLREAGLQVPDDIALASFDDINVARHLDLTTVHVPMRLIGHEAARQALSLIEGRDVSRRIVLPTRLVVRGSSRLARAPAIPHP
ncbi:MAG: LacI family transcriptional regulator [Lentisphaerae bacterium]|nr:LacI family transcriptional regulator [Lentisphaerota bacterium]